jgi:hypothetical protein
MAIQPIRGNPEQKQIDLTTGFRYGMNITYSDDLLQPSVLRQATNFDLESIGELTARKGFGVNNALTELLYPGGVYVNNQVNLTTQKEVFFTLLQNDNSVWRRLAESASLDDYLFLYTGTTLRYLRLLVVTATQDLYWEDVTIIVQAVPTVTIRRGTISAANFNYAGKLLNWEYVDKYGRLYFTNNDKGLLIYDSEEEVEDPWIYVGDFTGKDNEAYLPNAIEVRKIGFNVLGDSPLSWLYESELTTETIQGVYLTTSDRKPIQVIPPGESFQVNILYTGDVYAFTLVMREYDAEIEITFTKNSTYSVNGSLAVYDVTMVTQPTDEIEIQIDFDDDTVTLESYYDYFPTGQVPASAEVISQLIPGDFKIMEVYDRMLYYKGNVIWFSEVDVYDYVPNYNYVIVPLDKTDEIVRIAFFRDSYLVFTKRKIFKLYGDFESSNFRLELVNDNIGTISPNTINVLNNEMVFISTLGLRSLKTDTFKANFENIKEFDEAIRPLIVPSEDMYAIVYKDQYLLFTNQRGNYKTITCNYREYQTPDQVRFYYKQGAFVTDIYAPGVYPDFVFLETGDLYSFRSNGLYRYGDAFTDFGEEYELYLETIGMNFGYATHEKKIKHVILKCGGGEVQFPIVLQVAADGQLASSSLMVPTGIDESGNIIYSDQSPVVGSSLPILNVFGDGLKKQHTKKFRTSARGKNISIRIIAKPSDMLSLNAIGMIFKLGKVRE